MSSPRVPPRPDPARPSVDVATVQRTIDQGRGLRDLPLTMESLADLERLLRGHITLLLPQAHAATERLPHDSAARHVYISRTEAIERQAEQGLGEGTLSAHVQVAQLARDCQWLLERHQGTEALVRSG